jgi:hypothetical protein
MEPHCSAQHSKKYFPILSQIDKVHAPHPTSRRSILILFSHLHLGLQGGLLPSDFPAEPYIYLTCPPYMLQALLISVFLIWSPEFSLLIVNCNLRVLNRRSVLTLCNCNSILAYTSLKMTTWVAETCLTSLCNQTLSHNFCAFCWFLILYISDSCTEYGTYKKVNYNI